eukprot:TRINITY_DN25064_c0_g1_i6.p1 TRINITY_DN25064_c0_g1~~TRINITY_DN25064_c0_g1_i6.p1  ORF type:complete len:342 (-),score=50.86 TRINITY_DN25064_c0_g1_i6:135-1100(-)
MSLAPPRQGLWRWGDRIQPGELPEQEALELLSERTGFTRDLEAERRLRLGVVRDFLRQGLFVLRRPQQPVISSKGYSVISTPAQRFKAKEKHFLNWCNSAVMDSIDPLVPQLQQIWVKWEDCALTVVQLRMFLFIARFMVKPGILPNALQQDGTADSLELEWGWLLSQGSEAFFSGRWDVGGMLSMAAELIGCIVSSSERRIATTTLEETLPTLSEFDVSQGLCEGHRLGIWQKAHLKWVEFYGRERFGQIHPRPRPFVVTCGQTWQSQQSHKTIGVFPSRSCKESVRISYRQRIPASSPWFPHRHQLFMEQLYFWRLFLA